MSEPWERQAKESTAAYAAFCVYRDLGAGRTVSETARQLNQNESQIYRWKTANKWQERADSFDNEITRRAITAASKDYAKMITRQIRNGELLQDRAMRAIMAMDFDKASLRSLHSVVELMSCGVEMERTARELSEAKFNADAQEITITIKDRTDES